MLYPTIAMVVLTFIVLFVNFYWRVQSVRQKQVSIKYYRVYDDDSDVPERLAAGKNHFANLFETPILFYLVSVLTIVYNVESLWSITFAWLYVLFRCIHAFIHMTSNNVIHRMQAFGGSVFLLMALWLMLVIQII